ncbi:MAG: hypothetical protein KDK70_08170 [Myxococcales bacterium]|nr:hypothetical protein [Myxococcales bacterium]
MPLDLQRMLDMCRRQQWRVDDLDWSRPPRRFDPQTEQAVVQYFTDMAGIERMAGELFRVQRDTTDDPILREIFDTFVEDERRHAEVARRLAAHYDVRGLRRYALNPHLRTFHPRFVEVLRHVSPDIANVYITCGELLLDVALLRSLDDFVADPTCADAMERINRDESRHIAVDYHMMEYYGSPAYAAIERARPPRDLATSLHAARATARLLWAAGPFFRDVFFRPMDMVDPSGRRLLEAFKRMQLLGRREGIEDRPFTRFLATMQALYERPVVGEVLGPVIARAMGLDPRVIRRLYTEAEAARVRRADMAALAEEALAVKRGIAGDFDVDAELAARRVGTRLWTDRLGQPLARLHGWARRRASRLAQGMKLAQPVATRSSASWKNPP